MPETNETNSPDKEISNNSSKTDSFKENLVDKKSKTHKSRYTKSSNYKKHEYPKPNVIVYPKDHDSESITQAKRANKLTIISIFINTLLFFTTLLALAITWKSVNVAENTLSYTREKDSLDYIRDTTNDRKQEQKDNLTIALANKSLQAQIGSIQETQKQFEVENVPYLQIINPKILPMTVGSNPVIDYEIHNLRLYPVKIISKINFWGIGGKNPPKLKNPEWIFKSGIRDTAQSIDRYVIKESPIGLKSVYPDVANQVMIDQLTKGIGYIYAFTEIVYINLANGKKRIYRCGLRLKPIQNGTTFSEFVINENKDLKN